MNCSTTPTRGASPTWVPTGRRRSRNSAPSDRATIMSICCATRRALSGSACTSAAAAGKDGMNVPPAVIDEDSEIGRRYIAAMQLAGRYSYAGREWVIERVRRIIGGVVTDLVHNHHNYAWRERHGDRDLWV